MPRTAWTQCQGIDLMAERLDPLGMVVDFTDIKRVLRMDR
jgi:hypothetical protein